MAVSGLDMGFFAGKDVLLTGHTGFKGSWLSRILIDAGAKVTGYALEPPTDPSLFQICGLSDEMDSVTGDIRDLDHLESVFKRTKPQIVIHMAAQPLVRLSYREPRYTFETNVMGTVNLLECVRASDSVRTVLNVTTDKVYLNREWERGYVEDDSLDGYDPYSNSKSCSELVTHSYASSFLREAGVSVSTARAGNVIGGGDFAADRIIPDCVRAGLGGGRVIVRNPSSTRPYQHVLEPLFAYLMIAEATWADSAKSGYYNVGPDDCDCVDTGSLVTMFCDSWNARIPGKSLAWEDRSDGGPHEAGFLKLDCGLLKRTFDWTPSWHISDAVDSVVEWTAAWDSGRDVDECMREQIDRYLGR